MSSYVLLHHMMGGIDGVPGAWAYVEGGMGAVSSAIAKSAMASGATIVTEAVSGMPDMHVILMCMSSL